MNITQELQDEIVKALNEADGDESWKARAYGFVRHISTKYIVETTGQVGELVGPITAFGPTFEPQETITDAARKVYDKYKPQFEAQREQQC
jgi:mannose/cellobiose epimerase-like protein (N-acyl-D-glucosamine 2-epimerase family)